MTAPSVILFDLDDTLFQHSEAVAAGVLAHRHSHGGAIAAADDRAEFARWQALEEHHYHRYLQGELDFFGQRRARARDFVAPYNLDLADDGEADAWFGTYVDHYRRGWMLHDDTLPALDALAHRIPGVRYGIITNAVLAFQTEKLDAIGLSPRLEHVVASGEVGVAKPDARIFAHACELFGVPASDAAYVGDRLGTDAIGSAEAGLAGVWLCRGRRPSSAESAAAMAVGVRVIGTLAELPEVLAG